MSLTTKQRQDCIKRMVNKADQRGDVADLGCRKENGIFLHDIKVGDVEYVIVEREKVTLGG